MNQTNGSHDDVIFVCAIFTDALSPIDSVGIPALFDCRTGMLG